MSSTPRIEVAILVVSWDGYQDVWAPFFRLFRKYWNDCPYPVYLGTNHLHYEDEGVTVLPIGPDVDFSSNLILMLQHLEEEWVILWVDDALLSRSVNTSLIKDIVQEARDRDAGYVKLRINPLSVSSLLIPSAGTTLIREVPKDTRYAVSVGVGLWKRELLLELLRPGESAWDIERQVQIRAQKRNERFFSIGTQRYRQQPFIMTNSIWRRMWTVDGVRLLNREDMTEYISSRARQSQPSYIYNQIYSFLRYCYYRIRLLKK